MNLQRHGDANAAMRLLLTVFVVLALAGCGSSEATDTGATGDETETAQTETGADEESSTGDSSRDGGSDDDPDKSSDDESDDAASDDGDDDSSAEDSDDDDGDEDSDDGQADDAEGEDPGDTDEEDDDVAPIDPDDVELNPEVLEPDNKTTPSIVPPGSGSYDGALEPLVEQAMADLESRLNVEASVIGVHSAAAKTWPDSSAGCPQPGMAYTQVVTEGTEIVLMVNGTTYRYTTGGASSAPRLCET